MIVLEKEIIPDPISTPLVTGFTVTGLTGINMIVGKVPCGR